MESQIGRRFFATCVVALFATSVHAQSGDVVVSANTSWPEAAYALDSLRVENGATLTIAGGSTVNVATAVLITGNATILLQGKNNVVQVDGQWVGEGVTLHAGSLQVDAGSRISADAQGYGTFLGPGAPPAGLGWAGGTYGGHGHENPTPTYGSYLAPTDLGSGGGGGGGTNAGGGAIRLIVGGTLTNNGTITANGWDSATSNVSGGAGGSVYITTGTLAGAGTVTAKGSAGPTYLSPGGGGRIAIHYAVDGGFAPTAVTASAGGAGATDGSVYLIENGTNLYVPHALALPPDTNASYAAVTVSNGTTLTLGGGSMLTVTGLLRVSGNATVLVQSKNTTGQVGGQWAGVGATIQAASLQVDAGSRISADAQGYGTFLGPGAPPAGLGWAGGTHGGRGDGNPTPIYGSYLAPTDLGSGGGAGGGTNAGGGAIRLIVGGTLTNNGTITANGWDSATPNVSGGAGGSVYITTGTLAGAGTVTAKGSAGPTYLSPGGGGRIAIHYAVDGGFVPTAVTASAGGAGATDGSVYLIENGTNLYVPHALALPPDTNASYAAVTVSNGTTLTLGGGSTLTVTGLLRVSGNATVLVQSKNTTGQVGGQWAGVGATIQAASLQVDAGSRISADAQGYGTFLGPGAPPAGYYSSGGTYGGQGKANPTRTYGSQLAPTDLGSGGGAAGGTNAGGGAIRLIVGGTLTNNGTITANGWDSATPNVSGGAGGSVYVTTGTLVGTGTFTASGSAGPTYLSPGGGGRIAIYYANSTFGPAAVTARSGGAGATDGTVALVISPPTLTSVLPAAGVVGAAVTLSGTGFTWATQVNFNPSIASPFAVVSDTQITAAVPANATTGAIQVVTAGGTATSATAFSVIPPLPTVTTVSPRHGGVGATITLTGSGFTWATEVRFNATKQLAFTIVSDTQIRATVPAGASSGPVHVVNSSGTATSATTFTVIVDGDLDFLPDEWEQQFGLDPRSAEGNEGQNGDPDGDGLTNLQEFEAGTHPRGFFTRHLAEGATIGFFNVNFAILNAGSTAARVNLRFLRFNDPPVSYPLTIQPRRRATVRANDVPELSAAEFATVVESDVSLVVDRTMSWDLTTPYGGHAETSVAAPALHWYLAEGATHSGLDLFYLLLNPGSAVSQVRVRFLVPSGEPLEKVYDLPPNSRTNIWVDVEEFGGRTLLANTDVSAAIDVLNGQPIIVERAMYKEVPGQLFGAGHASAGVTLPALDWFLAEGATGDYFDLFVLIANPGDVEAHLQVTYLLPDGSTVVKPYVVGANSRFNIWVDYEDARLGDTAVSTTIRSTNGVPIIVERAMWWPGSQWIEAHNSPGATTTGTMWALAEGEVDAARNLETYILLANTSSSVADVRVMLLFEDGATAERTFAAIPANSRFNVPVGGFFPEARGRRFGAIVESLGTTPAQIVVERAMYWDAAGVEWAAGTNALATRIR